MTSFADSIEFRHKSKAEVTGHKLFHCAPTFPIDSFEQKTALRYRLKNNPVWIFEIARYDTYAVSATLPKSTQWGATFWNGDWDTTLAEHSSLNIGQAATWDPQLSTFFKPGYGSASTEEDAGLWEFLRNLQAVLGVLDGLKGSE